MNATNVTEVDSDAIVTTYQVFLIAQIVMVSLIYLVFPIEFIAFCEYQYAQRLRARKDRIMGRLRWCLMLNALMVMIAETLVLNIAYQTGLQLWQCDTIAKSTGIVYLFGVCFAYLFLLQKVKLVSKFLQDRTFHRVLWWVECIVMMLVPGCIPLYGYFVVGRITKEGRCIQTMPLWIFWSFSSANTVMSVALIYLFVTPLKRFANMQISAVQIELKRIYWWTMVVSSFAVVFTATVVLGYGLLHYFAEISNEHQLSVIGLCVMSWDGFVVAMCCRLTTFCWIPTRCRKCTEGDGMVPNVANRSSSNHDEDYVDPVPPPPAPASVEITVQAKPALEVAAT